MTIPPPLPPPPPQKKKENFNITIPPILNKIYVLR